MMCEQKKDLQKKTESPLAKIGDRQKRFVCSGQQMATTTFTHFTEGLQENNEIKESPLAKIADLRKIFDKKEQEKEELQKKIDAVWKILDDLQRKTDLLQKNFDKKEQEKEELQKKIEDLQKNLDKCQEEKEELQKEIDRRKSQFKSAWRNAPLYADWRKEEFEAVSVTLDAATAHPVLLLSENGRRVTWQDRYQDLPNSTQRFTSLPCVLGQLDISSGRCYWEVEVGKTPSWDLGICMDNVTRKERVTMSPQNGFWAIRFYEGEYWALPETRLTLREKPLSVGIFLDYEAGDISFYNMTDGYHIFTFPQNTFYGVLKPLFILWSSDSGALTIVQVEEN